MFYQQKFFWGFSNYMVRNKLDIERYIKKHQLLLKII